MQFRPKLFAFGREYFIYIYIYIKDRIVREYFNLMQLHVKLALVIMVREWQVYNFMLTFTLGY